LHVNKGAELFGHHPRECSEAAGGNKVCNARFTDFRVEEKLGVDAEFLLEIENN
jgi:hypothetical protein